MFGSIFMRLLWKEYRAQRGLWLAVLLLGISAVSFFASLPVDVLKQFGAPPWGMLVLAICIGYVAGSSAVLFGGEVEQGTFDLLKSWGVRAGVFLLGKFTFTTLSTLILAGLLGLFAHSIVRPDFIPFWISGMPSRSTPFWMTLPGAIECLVLLVGLCVFLSLMTRHVIVSIALALPSLWFIVDVPVLRLLAWMILAIDVVLVCRELGQKPDLGTVAALGLDLDFPAVGDPWTSNSGATGTTWNMFKRLLWTDSQYIRWIVRGCVIVMATLVILWMISEELIFEIQTAFPVAGTLSAMLLPAFVFQSERSQGRIQFHSERGADPGMFWLCKLAVWFPLLLAITMGFAAVAVFFLPKWRAFDMDPVAFLRFVFAAFLLFYSCGQLCSLWFRSSVMGALIALAVDSLLLVWLIFAEFIQLPHAVSTWPLAAGLLTASRLFVGSWLDGALGAHLYRRSLAAVGGSLVVMLSGVIVYRMCEVPWFSRQHRVPSLKNVFVARTPTRAALESRELYHKAFAEIRNPELAWPSDDNAKDALEPNRKAIELALLASKRWDIAPEDGSFLIQNRRLFSEELHAVAGLILQAGLEKFREGAIDSAFEYYLAAFHIAQHLDQVAVGERDRGSSSRIEERAISCVTEWAVAPSQTTERVRGALESLKRLLIEPSTPDASIRNGKEFCEYLLDSYRPAIDSNEYEMLAVNLPWEKLRSRQLVERIAAENHSRLHRVQDLMVQRVSLLPDMLGSDGRWENANSSARTRFRNSTPTYALLRLFGEITDLERAEVERQNRRNAFLVIMALCCWRLEHGTLPEDLESLRIPYFSTGDSSHSSRKREPHKQMPPDVWTGKPFAYFPSGIQSALGDTGFSREQPMLVSLGQLLTLSSESKSLENNSVALTQTPACFPIPAP